MATVKNIVPLPQSSIGISASRPGSVIAQTIHHRRTFPNYPVSAPICRYFPQSSRWPDYKVHRHYNEDQVQQPHTYSHHLSAKQGLLDSLRIIPVDLYQHSSRLRSSSDKQIRKRYIRHLHLQELTQPRPTLLNIELQQLFLRHSFLYQFPVRRKRLRTDRAIGQGSPTFLKSKYNTLLFAEKPDGVDKDWIKSTKLAPYSIVEGFPPLLVAVPDGEDDFDIRKNSQQLLVKLTSRGIDGSAVST